MLRRTLVIGSAAVALLVSTRSAAGSTGDDPDQMTIDAKDLKKYFAPYVAGVRECYAVDGHGPEADGNLRLELVIHRDGSVFRFDFTAPGVAGAWLRKLDTCLRGLSESWHFPVRRGFTTAVLPFYFQRTDAPGAGPITGTGGPR